MHQMQILTNKVSSVILGPKMLGIKKSENCKEAGKTPQKCPEIEPNPLRDNAIYVKEIIIRFEMIL
jgi:hypothetical protein